MEKLKLGSCTTPGAKPGRPPPPGAASHSVRRFCLLFTFYGGFSFSKCISFDHYCDLGKQQDRDFFLEVQTAQRGHTSASHCEYTWCAMSGEEPQARRLILLEHHCGKAEISRFSLLKYLSHTDNSPVTRPRRNFCL